MLWKEKLTIMGKGTVTFSNLHTSKIWSNKYYAYIQNCTSLLTSNKLHLICEKFALAHSLSLYT